MNSVGWWKKVSQIFQKLQAAFSWLLEWISNLKEPEGERRKSKDPVKWRRLLRHPIFNAVIGAIVYAVFQNFYDVRKEADLLIERTAKEKEKQEVEFARAVSTISDQVTKIQVILRVKREYITQSGIRSNKNSSAGSFTLGKYFDYTLDNIPISLIEMQIPALKVRDTEASRIAERYIEELGALHALNIVLEAMFTGVYSGEEGPSANPFELARQTLSLEEVRHRLPEVNLEKLSQEMRGRGPLVEVISTLQKQISSVLHTGDSLLEGVSRYPQSKNIQKWDPNLWLY